jgi:hypothetical protein
MPDPDSLTDDEHADHVEAVAERRRAMTINPDPGRPPQLSTLAEVNGLEWGAELLSATGLHFDERHLVATPHDQIDVAVAAAEAMGNDAPPIPHEPTGGDPLTEQPEMLTCFRHGASLQSPADKSRTQLWRAVSFERVGVARGS